MEILNDLKMLVGAKIICVRVTMNDVTDCDRKGIIYTTTDNILDKITSIADLANSNITVSESYWDDTFLYSDIFPLYDLSPATKYYLKAFAIKGSEIVFGNIEHTYTTKVGEITYSFNESLNDEGKCIVTDYDGSEKDWTTEYTLLQDVIKRSVDYLNMAGYLPANSFVVMFNKDYYNGTAAMNSSGANRTGIMYFYKIGYITLCTCLHEIGHFIDYNFANGLSNYTYFYYNAYGYLLGKKLNLLCQFWFNNTTAKTCCHKTHVYPFTEYHTTYDIEADPIPELLHIAAAMFNVVKGYDGFIGSSNKDIVVPFYSINEGSYMIKGKKSGKYITTDGTNLLLVDEADLNAAWTITYNPSTSFYYIKNVNTNVYIDLTTSTYIASTESAENIHIIPTIYDAADGSDTFAISQGLSTYSKTRKVLADADSISLYSLFNPRLDNYAYSFIKI